MKIGIIGAGNIGGTLARKFVAAGHSVKLAGSKSPDSIRELAENIGAEPVAAVEAVKDVEVIVLSIPFAKIPEVAGLFSTVPAEVVVIDTSNYYPQLHPDTGSRRRRTGECLGEGATRPAHHQSVQRNNR